MARKYNLPLNLKRFAVVSSKRGNPTCADVVADLKAVSDYLLDVETAYLRSQDFRDLTDDLISGTKKIPGSFSNMWARKNIQAYRNHTNQVYNTTLMFQTNMVNKLDQYVQSKALFDLLGTYTSFPDPYTIIGDFKAGYPHLKAPKLEVVKAHLVRWNKGQRTPKQHKPNGLMPVYTADMYYCPKVEFTDKKLWLSIKLDTYGLTRLEFDLPDTDRFRGATKVTRPTIVWQNNQPIFCFTVEKPIPNRTTPNFMGVDLGKVDKFVATVVDPVNMEHSAPFHTSRRTNKLDSKVQGVWDLAKLVQAKADLCWSNNRTRKAEVLETEADRLRAKATRLKNQMADQVAVDVVSIADQTNSTIILENLSWVGSRGGKWDHSRVQTKVEFMALQKGLKVKKVSPKNTSQDCTRCGQKVTHRGRTAVCKPCRFELNRDVMASRNLALKPIKERFYTALTQKNSTDIRRSYPVFQQVSPAGPGPLQEVTLFLGVETSRLCNLRLPSLEGFLT